MADYLATDTELVSVANAIRTKGGTSDPLEWPQGYVEAIGAISSGSSGVYVEMAQQDYGWHGLVFNGQWQLLPTRSATTEGETVIIESQSRDWIIDNITGVDSGSSIPFTSSGSTYTFVMPNESVSISWYYDD